MGLAIPSATAVLARLWVQVVELAGPKARRSLPTDYHKGRLKWAGSDPLLIDQRCSGSTKSGGAPSQLTATIMASFMESGDLDRHICHTLQPAYEKRYRTMISAVEKHLIPLGVTLPQLNRDVVGGYFVWISLPSPLDADHVATRAKEGENLIVAPGSLFRVHGDSEGQDTDGKLRLCFSYEDEQLLADGVERLGGVIRRLQQA